MKIKSLNDKLELYYDRIKNPQKVIGNWSIIDLDLLNSLKEIKLDNINYVDVYKNETLISLESKNYYILIKISFNFIAVKITNKEYNLNIKDWDLIAVDSNFVYKGNVTEPMTNKQIIKFLGFRVSKKFRKDLEYFS
jgi:hypothetical protein